MMAGTRACSDLDIKGDQGGIKTVAIQFMMIFGMTVPYSSISGIG